MLLHASCVAHQGRGVLIRGASGSGKSGLALQLMALGAMLVSDDRTEVIVRDGWPVARPPDALAGLIEARGIGILTADWAPARLVLAVDLDLVETERLPPDRRTTILGQRIALLHKAESLHFAASILQYLKGGKAAVE